MKIRQCLWCKADISHKRADAKFCNSTCRSRYHKLPQQIESMLLNNRKRAEKVVALSIRFPETVAVALGTFNQIIQNVETVKRNIEKNIDEN